MTHATGTTGRDRFVTVAAELFARHGFGPVALDAVIAASGVTKTTFYKHFESKDDLILAVLAHQHEVEMAELLADIARRGGPDPRAQILAIFDTFDAWFADTDFRGCMFLNAATEFPQETDPIHQAAIKHGAALHELIQDKCRAAGADAASAATVAAQMLVLMSGAIISRQTAKQHAAAQVARRTAELVLQSMD